MPVLHGFSDDDYIAVGASILPTAADVFAKAEMIVKVKEPQAVERAMLREGKYYLPIYILHQIPQTEELISQEQVCLRSL
ncbi:hypothetical protein O9992_15775 [Vibrio lentus]|nr:hypothetical protein [Vibrio lentus]